MKLYFWGLFYIKLKAYVLIVNEWLMIIMLWRLFVCLISPVWGGLDYMSFRGRMVINRELLFMELTPQWHFDVDSSI